jgi:hypothetical protein
MTDSEKLDRLNRRLRRMEVSQHIQTAIVVIAFLGIVSLGTLIKKTKRLIK